MVAVKFSAKVVSGAGRGHRMGIPTLNVDLQQVPKALAEGIYACWVILGEQKRIPGALHYGPRSVHRDSRSCEVHLIGEALAHAPITVDIEVVQRIRDVQDFASEEALIRQIEEDIRNVLRILGS